MQCAYLFVLAALLNPQGVLGIWKEKLEGASFIQKPENQCKSRACRHVLDPWLAKKQKSRWPDVITEVAVDHWDTNSTDTDHHRRSLSHTNKCSGASSWCFYSGMNCNICIIMNCPFDCNRRLQKSSHLQHQRQRHRNLGQCLNLYWDELLDQSEFRLRLSDADDLDLPGECPCDLDDIWYVEHTEWVDEPSDLDGTKEAEDAEKAMLDTLEVEAKEEYEMAKLELERAEDLSDAATKAAEDAADDARHASEDALDAAEEAAKKEQEAAEKAEIAADFAVAAVEAHAHAKDTAAAHSEAKSGVDAARQRHTDAKADFKAAKKARENASSDEEEDALKVIEAQKKVIMENAKKALELAKKAADSAKSIAEDAAKDAQDAKEDADKKALEAAKKQDEYVQAQEIATLLQQAALDAAPKAEELAVLAAEAEAEVVAAEDALAVAKANHELAKDATRW